jgi:hypothetical protein
MIIGIIIEALFDNFKQFGVLGRSYVGASPIGTGALAVSASQRYLPKYLTQETMVSKPPTRPLTRLVP